MGKRTFVGIGFGPIQAGLFLYEAHRAGAFGRLVVAEVAEATVAALRAAGGTYRLNVATPGGVEAHTIPGVEVFNPGVPADRAALVDAVADATEIATALPSIAFYNGPSPAAAARVLADGFRRKEARGGPRAVIYTAENNNHAAEALEGHLRELGGAAHAACLNTVIGKMSGVVDGAEALAAQGLAPITPGQPRAFLVEAFNRILISRIPWPDFARGIRAFEEKSDLLPFEEAKLYGHNATHALLGYLLWRRGAATLAEAAGDPDLMAVARAAFLEESGVPLCRKHAGLDPLFTPAGFGAYVDDLLARMVNPFLQDAVARITRDPLRKLAWNDRLVGTMRLALGQGVRPLRFARAARAAVHMLDPDGRRGVRGALADAWDAAPAADAADADADLRETITRMIEEAPDAH